MITTREGAEAKRKVDGAAPEGPRGEARSFEYDPRAMAFFYAGEVPQDDVPGSGLGDERLHALARMPWVAPFHQRRINQAAEFCQRQASPYALGFRVRLRDLEAKATRAVQKEARAIEDMLLRGDGTLDGGGFEGVVRRLMRDSLVYDRAVAEIIYSRGRKPWGLSPCDATAFRRARPKDVDQARGRWSRDPKRPAFVEILDGRIVNEFMPHETLWGIRRPRTWRYAAGYGFSELEEAATVIADLTNARVYNSVAFTNGVHASTIIAVKSMMSPDQFEAFKLQLQNMMLGVRQARRMPVIQMSPGREGSPKDEIQAIPLSNNNRDMEYSSWVNFNLKLVAALLGMDPAEIGFVYGNEGQSSTLNARGPGERVQISKEGGLRPMLRALAHWLNVNLVWRWSEDFVVEFVGLDAGTEEQRVSLDAQTVKTIKTINEIRAEHDLPRIDSPIADMILDSTYINSAMQLLQQEQGGGDEAAQDLPEGMTGPGDDAGDERPAVGDGGDVDWNDVHDWTTKVTDTAEKAWRSGRWSMSKAVRPSVRRPLQGRRYGLVPDVRARRGPRVRHIVEVV